MEKYVINLLNELSQYHRTREVILEEALNKRLDTSLQSYIESINYSLTYLSNRKPINVLKRLNK